MDPISLTTFVDFTAATGPNKVRVVRHHLGAEYDVKADFYKRPREALIECLADSLAPAHLNDALEQVTNKVKRKHFPALVAGYQEFYEQLMVPGDATGFAAPKARLWSRNGMHVRVNPEAGMILAGNLFLLKLYFKKEKLVANRVQIITHLMETVFQDHVPEKTTMAVLDVRKGKLMYPAVSPDVDIQLDGEAAYWAAIASRLENPLA